MRVCPQCKKRMEARLCPTCRIATLEETGTKVDDLVGKLIQGKYEVTQLLGRGGMGAVYAARNVTLDSPVAIKVLRTDVVEDLQGIERFYREARAASRLRHPNTVRVFDFGQIEDGRLFIAMEYLEGVSLAAELRRVHRMPEERVLRIAEQVCMSLAEAHGMDPPIVHRDIKPPNVLLTKQVGLEDFVKVLDFGIAKVMGEESLTGTAERPGTPRYMSPEQCLGRRLDGRSDLYSLGVMMYEMANGSPPFQSDTPLRLLMMHVQEEPRPLREVCPDVSPAFSDLVMALLKKNPDERPRSAEELLARIAAVRQLGAARPATRRTAPAPEPPVASKTLRDVATPARAVEARDVRVAQVQARTRVDPLAHEENRPQPPASSVEFAPVHPEDQVPTTPISDPNAWRAEGQVAGPAGTHAGPVDTLGPTRYVEPPPAAKAPAGLRPPHRAPQRPRPVPAGPPEEPAGTLMDSEDSAQRVASRSVEEGMQSVRRGHAWYRAPRVWAVALMVLAVGGVALVLSSRHPEGSRPEPAVVAQVAEPNAPPQPASAEPPAAPAQEAAQPPEPTAPDGFVAVQAGTYWIGCTTGSTRCHEDEPAQQVRLSAFAIKRTEVSVAEYRECVQALVCTRPGRGKGCLGLDADGSLPINCVDYVQAETYCKFKGATLPTEVQWEVAARATRAGQPIGDYPWGPEAPSCARTVMAGCGGPRPVGTTPRDKSPFGAMDMGGNLREWTKDLYLAYPGGKATEGLEGFVNRGGSFEQGQGDFSTSHTRDADARDSRRPDLGFRCVVSL